MFRWWLTRFAGRDPSCLTGSECRMERSWSARPCLSRRDSPLAERRANCAGGRRSCWSPAIRHRQYNRSLTARYSSGSGSRLSARVPTPASTCAKQTAATRRQLGWARRTQLSSAWCSSGTASGGLPPASHLLVRFLEAPGRTWDRPGKVERGLDGDAAVPRVPTVWPALLGPGDRIPRSVSISSKAVLLPAWTQEIAPLAPFSMCATGGFVAMFTFTGNSRPVVADLARQFKASGFEQRRATQHRDGDVTVSETVYDNPGGGTFEARTIERPAARSFLQLLRCND